MERVTGDARSVVGSFNALARGGERELGRQAPSVPRGPSDKGKQSKKSAGQSFHLGPAEAQAHGPASYGFRVIVEKLLLGLAVHPRPGIQ